MALSQLSPLPLTRSGRCPLPTSASSRQQATPFALEPLAMKDERRTSRFRPRPRPARPPSDNAATVAGRTAEQALTQRKQVKASLKVYLET